VATPGAPGVATGRGGSGRPALLLGGSAPRDLERVARRGDGWHAAGIALERLGPLWRTIRERADGAGRDPGALEMVVAADLVILDRPAPFPRPAYCGVVEQVAEDLDVARRAGATEIVLGFSGDVGFDEALDAYARVTETLGGVPTASWPGAPPARG